jgi:uncharacterized protein (DUF169 family)
VIRLIQGRLFQEGDALTFTVRGGASCANTITLPLLSDECQVVMPGPGERIVAHAEGHEIALSLPASKVAITLKGLEAGHQIGVQRYPVPSYLRYQPQHPPGYDKLFDALKAG